MFFPALLRERGLLFPFFCDIKVHSRNAKNGKIGCFLLSERAGHRLKACLGSFPLVRPGAAPERGTVVPPLREMKCVSKDANAGGTAEGLPFVPIDWDERLFCFLFRRHTMFTRRICSLFACSAVALLLLVFCTGDSALSGNGQRGRVTG